MDLGLGGKVAVVTGAGKGIGLAIAKSLAAEGAQVVAGSRTEGGLRGLDGVTAVTVDLAAPDGPAALVQRALDDHGRVDVLVNNMGAVRLRLDGFLALTDWRSSAHSPRCSATPSTRPASRGSPRDSPSSRRSCSRSSRRRRPEPAPGRRRQYAHRFPALVALLGRWNWWLPRRPARLLRVEPSGVVAEVEPV